MEEEKVERFHWLTHSQAQWSQVSGAAVHVRKKEILCLGDKREEGRINYSGAYKMYFEWSRWKKKTKKTNRNNNKKNAANIKVKVF